MSLSRYLLENKLISSEQFLDTILTQLNSTTSLFEILYKDLQCPPEKLTEVCLRQIESAQDLESTLKQTEIISSQKISLALEKRKLTSRPLIHLLVEKGYITLEKLKEANEEYEKLSGELVPKAESNSEVETQTTIDPAALETLRQQVADGIMDPAFLEQLEAEMGISNNPKSIFDQFKFPTVDQHSKKTFLENFSTTKIVHLNSSLTKLVNSGENFNELELLKVRKEVLECKGFIRLADLEILALLFDKLDLFLKTIKSNNSPKNLAKTMEQFFQIVMDLKLSIELESSEKNILESKSKDFLEKILNTLSA